MPPGNALPQLVRTQRLVLRRQQPEHALQIKDAVDASLEHLRAAVAWAQTPLTIPVLTARLAAAAAAFDAGTMWNYTVFDAAESRVLGSVGLEHAEPALIAIVGTNAMETGYWLRADATGYGYATEAIASLVEMAFTTLGMRRVAICHDPANAPSAGIPRRLGFTSLGVVPNKLLPNRHAADGSVRAGSMVWVLDAAPRADTR